MRTGPTPCEVCGKLPCDCPADLKVFPAPPLPEFSVYETFPYNETTRAMRQPVLIRLGLSKEEACTLAMDLSRRHPGQTFEVFHGSGRGY
jgi:hypothetical protein